jgi:predicted TIM-barrel fold metal-dependent hydrolase
MSNEILQRAMRQDSFFDLNIIDMHCHLGTGHEFYHARFHIDEMIAEADKLGIAKLCIAPEAGIECDYKLGNRQMEDAIKRYPDRIYGYICINPYHKDEIKEQLDRYYPIPQVVGVKIHPSGHQAPLDCEGYQIVFQEVERRGGFILSHTWEDSHAWCDLDMCERVMKEYPKVPFVLAHSGGTVEGVKKAIRMVNRYPNIYLDTCGFDVTQHWINELIEQCPFEKILFGTDFPYHDLRYGLTRILFSDLSDEQKIGLLSKNFTTLLKQWPKHL